MILYSLLRVLLCLCHQTPAGTEAPMIDAINRHGSRWDPESTRNMGPVDEGDERLEVLVRVAMARFLLFP